MEQLINESPVYVTCLRNLDPFFDYLKMCKIEILSNIKNKS